MWRRWIWISACVFALVIAVGAAEAAGNDCSITVENAAGSFVLRNTVKNDGPIKVYADKICLGDIPAQCSPLYLPAEIKAVATAPTGNLTCVGAVLDDGQAVTGWVRTTDIDFFTLGAMTWGGRYSKGIKGEDYAEITILEENGLMVHGEASRIIDVADDGTPANHTGAFAGSIMTDTTRILFEDRSNPDPTRCRIEFRLMPAYLLVRELGDAVCGGSGISFDGFYKRSNL